MNRRDQHLIAPPILSDTRHRRPYAHSHIALAAILLAALALPLYASGGRAHAQAPGASGEPGRGDNGAGLLIDNRSITPAGKQSSLGNLPLNAVFSPDGRHLLVSNDGAGVQSLQVVDTATGGVVQTIPYYAPKAVFVGLAYSPDGTRAYASGGGSNVIHTYDVGASGLLTATADIAVGDPTVPHPLGRGPWPIGLSMSPDGGTLYAADNLANAVSIIPTSGATAATTVTVGSYPYTTLTSHDGARVYVSNWGDNTVSVIDTASQTVVATIPVSVPNTVAPATSHPSAMALGPVETAVANLLFVALSNSDAVAVIDTASGKVVRTLSVAPSGGAKVSSSPEGLAVSPDGARLYVADAGSDDVTVFGLGGAAGPERKLGRIPTAWYPTAVAVSADSGKLFVVNGKGRGAGPNGPNGTSYYPDPTRDPATTPISNAVTGNADGYCNCTFDKYSGSMIVGTLSSVTAPTAAQLSAYTAVVVANNRENDSSVNDRTPANPVPVPGGASPIKHVIYIIKENRTYDQVFGDEPIGDSDASLTLFGRDSTPNLHALADRFGLIDNFYADAEVSADGHNWVMSANASDYNEKMWPQNYSSSPGRNRGYDFEGGTTINLSPGGYLWDAAAAAGASYRDYGEFVNNSSSATAVTQTASASCAGPVAASYIGRTLPAGNVLCFGPTAATAATTPNLVGHTDPRFRSYDLNYSDNDRTAEWQREFNQFVASGTLPQLEILRLPNDHTAGTRAGFPTPQAFVAQNDAAVGRVVDIVSHSAAWASTAIFVTEDDAQNGPDHVDAHRTEALVVSPYTSRPAPRVEHGLYDTAAMVRTIELILGLSPLSQYDANAQPMSAVFTSTVDLTPYNVVTPSGGSGGAPTPELGSGELLGGGLLAIGILAWRRGRRSRRLPGEDAIIPTALVMLLLVAGLPALGHHTVPSSLTRAAWGAPATPRERALQADWAAASGVMFAGQGALAADLPNAALLNHAIWYGVKGYGVPYPGDKAVLTPRQVLAEDHYLWQLRPDLGARHPGEGRARR